MKNNNFFNKKVLNLTDPPSGTDLHLMRHRINHPGRHKPYQYFNYYCGPATPPSKGGETFFNLPNYNNTLKLAAMRTRG